MEVYIINLKEGQNIILPTGNEYILSLVDNNRLKVIVLDDEGN